MNSRKKYITIVIISCLHFFISQTLLFSSYFALIKNHIDMGKDITFIERICGTIGLILDYPIGIMLNIISARFDIGLFAWAFPLANSALWGWVIYTIIIKVQKFGHSQK